MYAYISGKIIEINKTYIILENNNIGYFIYLNYNPLLKINNNVCVYTYLHLTETKQELYGFQKIEDKELFLALLKVKGIGPKLAMSLIQYDLKKAIEKNDYDYIKSLPRISEKTAEALIKTFKMTNKSENDLIPTLASLGYERKQIMTILDKINTEEPFDLQLKQALKLLLERG